MSVLLAAGAQQVVPLLVAAVLGTVVGGAAGARLAVVGFRGARGG